MLTLTHVALKLCGAIFRKLILLTIIGAMLIFEQLKTICHYAKDLNEEDHYDRKTIIERHE